MIADNVDDKDVVGANHQDLEATNIQEPDKDRDKEQDKEPEVKQNHDGSDHQDVSSTHSTSSPRVTVGSPSRHSTGDVATAGADQTAGATGPVPRAKTEDGIYLAPDGAGLASPEKSVPLGAAERRSSFVQMEGRARSRSVGEKQWTRVRAVMAWYTRLRRIKKSVIVYYDYSLVSISLVNSNSITRESSPTRYRVVVFCLQPEWRPRRRDSLDVK